MQRPAKTNEQLLCNFFIGNNLRMLRHCGLGAGALFTIGVLHEFSTIGGGPGYPGGMRRHRSAFGGGGERVYNGRLLHNHLEGKQ